MVGGARESFGLKQGKPISAHDIRRLLLCLGCATSWAYAGAIYMSGYSHPNSPIGDFTVPLEFKGRLKFFQPFEMRFYALAGICELGFFILYVLNEIYYLLVVERRSRENKD